MKKKWVPLMIIFLLFCFSVSCSNSDDEEDMPLLSSLSPDSKAVNMPQFTLRVKGSGFTEYSKIYFDDTIRPTDFVSETELTCTISAQSIASSGDTHSSSRGDLSSTTEIPVFVSNGGGKNSEELIFTLRPSNLFTVPAALNEEHSTSYNPAIAVDTSGNIYIAYERYDADTNTFFVSVIKSEDRGIEWSDPVDIFNSDERIYNTDIESGAGGSLYVTFYNIRLYISVSSDSGESWSTPGILSRDTPTPIESKIAVDTGGNLNVCWILKNYSSDTSVYYQRSTDGALTFSDPVNISTGSADFSSVYELSMGVNDSGIYVGWTAWPLGGSRYSYVYFNYSNDGGQTWATEDKYFGVCSASSVSAGESSEVYFALSSSYLPFQEQIALYRSNDAGETWNPKIGVTEDSDDAFPVVRTDSVGNINVIFLRGDRYLYVRSIDGGATWTVPALCSDKISYRAWGKLIDMALDAEGNMMIVSENDNIGMLYFVKSY